MASLTREAAKINELSTCEYSVAGPGKGPGGPAPHVFLDQNEAAPLPYLRVCKSGDKNQNQMKFLFSVIHLVDSS